MANEISVRVKAKDEASSTINKVAGSVNTFSKKLKESTQPLNNLTKAFNSLNKAAPGLIVINQAFNKITSSIKNAVSQMAEWEKSWAEADAFVKRIDFAARINKSLGATSEELISFSNELSTKLKGALAVDDINAEIAKLSFDKTSDQIKDIITVASDLSAALGTDLTTAVTQLNNTFSGNAGQLAKYFPELKNATTEGLKAGEALEYLRTKVAGVSEEMANSAQGSIQTYKNEMQNLKESLGQLVSNFMDPVRQLLTTMVKESINAIDKVNKRISDKKSLEEAEKTFQNKKGVWSTGRVSTIAADPTSAQYNDALRLLEVYQQRQKDIERLTEERKNTKVISVVRQIDNDLADLRANLKDGEDNYIRRIEDLQEVVENYKKAQELNIPGFTFSSSTSGTSSGGTTPEDDTDKKIKEIKARELKFAQDREKALRDAEQKEIDTRDEYVRLQKEHNEALKDILFGSMGEIGQIWNSVNDGNFKTVDLLVSIAANLLTAIQQNESVAETFNFISTTINAFVSTIDNALTNLFEPIATTLKQIGQIMGLIIGPIIQAIANILKPIFNFVSTIMQFTQQFAESFGGAFMSIFNALFSCVSWILELLNPIAAIMSYIFDTFSAVFKTIQWIGDMFIYYMGTIVDILNGKKKGNPFEDKKHEESLASIWKNAFAESWEDRLAKYNVLEGSASGFTAGAIDTYSGTNAASYTAARDININVIFEHSFVNGDATQIAIMLKNEMEHATKLGY